MVLNCYYSALLTHLNSKHFFFFKVKDFTALKLFYQKCFVYFSFSLLSVILQLPEQNNDFMD